MRPNLVAAIAVFVLTAAALPARAQVAVAASLPDPDPGQRDVAASIVAAAASRWQLLDPPLHPDATAVCKTDTACMLATARSGGATHLLVIGVASAGRRDHLVTLQLLDASGRALFDQTSVVPGGGEPRDAGSAVAAPLLRVDGPPRAPTTAPTTAHTTPPTTASSTGPASVAHLEQPGAPSVWTAAGVALVATGALLGGATAAFATLAAPDNDGVLVVGAAGAATLALAGLGCVIVDGL